MAVLILGTAFFVAAEFSLVTVDRHQIDQRADAGDRRARAVRGLLPKLAFVLSGTQLGVTVSSVVLGFVAEPTVAPLFEPGLGRAGAFAVAFTLVTVLSMVVGELIPKSVSIARAGKVSTTLARPLRLYLVVLGPLIRLLNRAVNATVRRLGIEPREELASVRSLEELELLIRSSGEEGTLDADAFTLLNRTLRFNDKTAADALVSRVAVQAVGPDDTVAQLVERSAATGFSRFPVVGSRGSDLDDVVGVVHVKDVYRLPVDGRAEAPVASIMGEPFVVPETRDLGSLLLDLRTGSHLAVVVDEYGGTAGIITLEDVLEEIVGEIDDEYDQAPPALTQVLAAGTYELPGTQHPDEVAEACGFIVPRGEYDTVAGFVLDRLGRVPEVGDRFSHDGWSIEVAAMDRRRIATVRLTAPEPETASRSWP